MRRRRLIDPALHVLLVTIHRAVPGDRLYLVGGTLRDLLAGQPLKDLDFAVRGSVTDAGRRLGAALGGSFFVLRKSDETSRVTLPAPRLPGSRAGIRQLDLAPLRGQTLEEDLLQRDYTVNAMGIALEQAIFACRDDDLPERIRDPLDGRGDLRAGIVRRCSPRSLPDDPLRILRAVRLSAGFGWRIERETRRQIQETAGLLRRVSAERIRDELFLLLSLLPPSRMRRSLSLLARLGLTEAALRGAADPDGSRRIDRILRFLSRSSPSMGRETPRAGRRERDTLRVEWLERLEEPIIDPRSRRTLVLLACLLPEPDPTAGESLVSRLALGTAEAKWLRRVREGLQAFLPLLPEPLTAPSTSLAGSGAPPKGHEAIDPVTVFRLFQRYGDAVPGILLRCAGEREDAEHDPAFIRRVDWWLDAWLRRRERYLPAPLLRGHDLMERWRQPGGAWVARMLDSLLVAQVSGRVTTVGEAWRHVEGMEPDLTPATSFDGTENA